MGTLKNLVPEQWRTLLSAALEAPSFAALQTFLDAEPPNVFPPREQLFAALAHTPPAKVKAVIIGQDPYPTKGNANGLCFSVSPGVKVPASLVNIYKGLHADLGLPISKTGDLTAWANSGVLLLNTVLSVREGEPNSHKKKGWEPFTEAVLAQVNQLAGPVIFFCFGAPAKTMAERLVDKSRHTLLIAPHPSPLNGNKFVTCVTGEKPFTRANQILTAAGRAPIDWSLD
jgi:uracil-DNA glycosylase